MLNQMDREGYAKLLADWVKYSQDFVYPVPGGKGLCYYSPGSHGHWGVHTNQKAFSAFAIAGRDPSIRWENLGLSRELVLNQALGMLRYSLSTHLSGGRPCVDGQSWGHSWIYILGIDRMMHAVEALETELSPQDREALRRLFISEAEWLLNEYPVEAGITEHNKPESNIWNGSILIRTAMLYPDTENADRYIEKGCKFFANGISIPSDETGEDTKNLFVGPNFTEQYGLNHHRYLNVGYMVICLSNLAMLHFSAKHQGYLLPPLVYHHAEELWRLVRTFTWDDGRLLRIGGDSRARYCYCQDYALPVWALAEDRWGEDTGSLESGWLGILQKEAAANGDGSFLSERLSSLGDQSPLYYTRLESDRANAVSMLVYWYRCFQFNPRKKSETLSAWSDDFHGAVFCAGQNRYASFVWNACEKPQALCVPRDDSSFAEWRRNLTGFIKGSGSVNEEEIGSHREQVFPGGFLSSGYTVCYADGFVAEGQTREDIARKILAFAALPDGKTVLGLEYVVSLNRIYGSMIKGIYWHIPNDIYNKNRRFIKCEAGTYTLRGGHWADKAENLPAGKWINADGKIGLAASLPLTIVRNGKRQIGLKSQQDINGSLYTEEICGPFEARNRWYEAGEILIDVAFASHIGGTEETQKLSESLSVADIRIPDGLGIVCADGADGCRYLLALNVSGVPVNLPPLVYHDRRIILLGSTSETSPAADTLSPYGAVVGYF
jgi:hypothetical protein